LSGWLLQHPFRTEVFALLNNIDETGAGWQSIQMHETHEWKTMSARL
jgi:hypothetical protein